MARQGAGQREGLGRKWAAQGEPPWPAEARRRAERTRMRMRTIVKGRGDRRGSGEETYNERYSVTVVCMLESVCVTINNDDKDKVSAIV